MGPDGVARQPVHRLAGLAAGRGFTLLELLVAMAVFSVMSVMAFGGLRSVLDASQAAELRAERLGQLQMAFSVIGRDVEQAIGREIRDEYGDTQPPLRAGALADGSLLELSRAGWRNPAGAARSTLQRVAYRLEEETLYRDQWLVLDRAQDSASAEAQLLTGVTDVRLRFLDGELQWHNQWPPLNRTEVMPTAMEIVLELGEWGEITRLFRTPGV